jgi:hypothetical protein
LVIFIFPYAKIKKIILSSRAGVEESRSSR